MTGSEPDSFPSGVERSVDDVGGADAAGNAGPFGATVPKPGPPPAHPTGSEPGAGAADVAQVTALLDRLDDLPVADHVQAFEAVHRALQDTLAAVDGS